MINDELRAMRLRILERMEDAYNSEGMERILNAFVSIHSTEGGAYYNMSDYLNKFNY